MGSHRANATRNDKNRANPAVRAVIWSVTAAPPGDGICVGNRLASFRADVHAGADDVEAVGANAGDQGVEFDDLGLHVLEPERFESGEDHVRHGSNQLAAGFDKAVWLFIGDPHQNRARLLDPVKRRVGLRE